MHWFIFLFAFSTFIQLGPEKINVEVVNTPEGRNKGLMWRKHLPEGSGMLFVYQKPDLLGFWMKNTLIPLSIAFFDENKKIINIEDMDPPQGGHIPRSNSRAPALYALEVPQGWFQKHQIQPGAKFSFLDQDNELK